jgi:hypothetical protein
MEEDRQPKIPDWPDRIKNQPEQWDGRAQERDVDDQSAG